MKNKLFLITQTYPHGNEEKSFLQPEIPYLREKFDLVIVPTEVGKVEIAEETIVSIQPSVGILRKIGNLFLFLLHKDFWVEMLAVMKSKHDIINQIMRAVMFGTAANSFYYNLKREINLKKDTEALFYFYWWDYKCFGLTMHKKRHPRINIVSRTHGFDLYDEREVFGRQFFKSQMDREMDRIVFISEYGRNYYLMKYKKETSDKYPIHRLGIRNCNEYTDDYSKRDEILLVSCSNVIGLKRVELIIEGLALAESNIHWVHFGDGELLEEMKNLAFHKLRRKANIQYEFKGYVTNNQILDYYAKHQVDCFITTSSTEGTPVSIQEALSLGIPVIGTDVGDIPFMVKGNGILLDCNPKKEDIAKAIEMICKMDGLELKEFRKKAYIKYLEFYNADKQYPEMVHDLLTIINN